MFEAVTAFVLQEYQGHNDRPHRQNGRDIQILTCCSLMLSLPVLYGSKRALRQYLKCSFRLLSCLPHYSSGYPAGERKRCELHQARLSQLEPLIITSQYQLQQPCADAKTLRGLATLPYLIWAGGSETVPYHQPIQSEARTAPHSASGVQSRHQTVQSHMTQRLSILHQHLFFFSFFLFSFFFFVCARSIVICLFLSASRSLSSFQRIWRGLCVQS